MYVYSSTAHSSGQSACHKCWVMTNMTTEQTFFGNRSQNNNKRKAPLEQWQRLQSKWCRVEARGPGLQWEGQRVACVPYILPMIVWCGSVMCFLTWGWAWMKCWHFKDRSLGPGLSLWSQQDYKLKPFHLTQQGQSCYPARGLLFVFTVF